FSAFYLDVGPIGADPRPGLVVSYNDFCYGRGARCGTSRFEAYRPPGEDPIWRSDDGGLGSGVALGDAGRAGGPHPRPGRWGIGATDGAPLTIYRGDERAFSPTPGFVSETRSVAESIAVGSLTRKIDALPVAEESFAITRPQAVVTLSRRVIAAIREVTR